MKDFSEIIKKNGGKVTKEENMGQREFAYEIKDFKSGYYFVFEVEKGIKDIIFPKDIVVLKEVEHEKSNN